MLKNLFHNLNSSEWPKKILPNMPASHKSVVLHKIICCNMRENCCKNRSHCNRVVSLLKDLPYIKRKTFFFLISLLPQGNDVCFLQKIPPKIWFRWNRNLFFNQKIQIPPSFLHLRIIFLCILWKRCLESVRYFN